jgi:hypothetical protein
MKTYILNTAQYFAAYKLMKANGLELELTSSGALWCYAPLTEQQLAILRGGGFSVREL